MDCLEQARTLYREYHRPGNTLTQEKQVSISTAISKLIRTSLLQQGGSASFRYLPFARVIQRTVGAGHFHGDRAAMAFLTLEKYLVLLSQQPWKREFWVLKLYGGYFCTKVRAHLDGAEQILQLVGFVPDKSTAPSQRLLLHEAPDTQMALNVAFDCQVASLECLYIEEYHTTMKCVGLDLVEAMNVLLSGASSNLLVGSSLPGDFGRSSGILGSMKVSYNPGSLLPDIFPLGRAQGTVKSHTFLASGGMGMGVVTGAKSMHQVIGVQPSHHAVTVGGGTTHQVIGVSATHRTTMSRPSPTTRVASPGSVPVESHISSSGSSPVREASTITGAGHSVLHVMGVPASHPARLSSKKSVPIVSYQMPHHPPLSSTSTSSPLPHSESPYSCPADAIEGMTVLSPHQQSSPLAGESSGRSPYVASHPHSVAYQPPGSRGSYASSAYGYGSGSASVLSGGSSACTGSSGYCSATSSSPSHDYANLPLKPVGDSVDSTPLSHSRLPKQSQKPQFSFIEEDDLGLGAPFPEATHEEHLQESLRNLQVGHPDKTQKRPLSKNISSQFAGGHGKSSQIPIGSSEAVAVTFDDWRWFRKETDKGLPSSCKMDAEGREITMYPTSGYVQPSAILRPSPSHPGSTALSADAVVTSVDTSSQSPVGQEAWKASVMPNPVYYPPPLADNLYENSPGILKGSPHPQHRASPTPSRKTMTMAAGRWEDRVPQIHRSRATPSPPPPPAPAPAPMYNNLDRTSQLKILNVPSDVGRSAFDEDVGSRKVRVGRASSLGTSTHYANLVDLSGGREDGGPYSVDRARSWTCGACTMQNTAGSRQCRTCGRGQGAEGSLFAVAGESRRVCPSCTFENPPGCRSCEVCEVLLPQDVHTYV